MKIKIKKLNPNAVIPFQAKEGDFCYDVVAVSEEEIAPNVWRYGLGFAYEIERSEITLGEWEEKSCFSSIIGVNPDGSVLMENSTFDAHFTVPEEYISNIKLSIDFRPRSSVWKTGMVLSNCVGTLDEFYRGEVAAIFYHVMPNMPRYKIGDKIGQIKLGFTIPVEFEEVEEIDMNTERGTGGFGSTGK